MKYKSKIISYKNIFNIVFLIVFILFVTVFVIDGINEVSTNRINFDEAYNAQVSKNLAKEGVYRVDYPDKYIFYNFITTGPTMLIPTSWLFKLFGISNLTTNLMALIYSFFSIIVMYVISAYSFKNICKTSYYFVYASIITILTVLSCEWYLTISYRLRGEIAELFFTLAAILCLMLFDNITINRIKTICIILSGMFMAYGFVSKTIQLFAIITIFGILLIRVMLNLKITVANYMCFMSGFVAGIISWDIYKYSQFGNIREVLRWWKHEYEQLFIQTHKDVVFEMPVLHGCISRFFALNDFFNAHWSIIALSLFIPVALFFWYLFHNSCEENDRYISIIILGVMSDSILIYSILFGNETISARRMAAYGIGLVFSNYMMLFFLIAKKIKSINMKTKVLIVIFIVLFCVVSMRKPLYANCIEIGKKGSMSKNYVATKLMAEYLDTLPEDAIIYTYGWFQAPEVSLLSNKTFHDISRQLNQLDILDYENTYLVTGSLVDLASENWGGTYRSYINELFDAQVIYEDNSYMDEQPNDGKLVVYKLLGLK